MDTDRPSRPPSLATIAVLKAVDEGAAYGFDIMDAAALPSGTVYPILGRLEQGGLVRSRWEAQTIAQGEKRPPRRYYELTRHGRAVLAAGVEHYRTLGGRLAAARSWRPRTT